MTREGSASRGEGASRLQRVATRLQEQGPAWLWRRFAYEIESPSTPLGKGLRGTALAALRLARHAKGVARGDAVPGTDSRTTLYAFYDLKVSPITFDVLWFVVGAEAARRRLGLAAIHFVIVPGPREGVREEDAAYERAVDAAARLWRVTYLLCPCFGLLASSVGWTVAVSRAEAAALRGRAIHCYPHAYEPTLPSSALSNDALAAFRRGARLTVLEAPHESRRQIARWLESHAGDRRCVTITLRSYGYMPARNSNEAAWIAFARRLDPALYLPVFLLDTERTLDPLPAGLAGLAVLPEAAWNIGLRLALYEASFVNLGVNNGPMALCWLSARARYLTFKMITPSVPQATEAFIRARGFEIGQSLPFAAPGQKWVWEDDSLDVIVREFDAMVALLEAREDGRRSPSSREEEPQ